MAEYGKKGNVVTDGGKVGSRGYMYQSIIAEIQCFERNDWDAIKVEPETENQKVDIMLYCGGKILTAMQVKSSINAFSVNKVCDWLEKLRADAMSAEEICLCLVGDSFSSECESLITKHQKEIKRISFRNLKYICTGKLIEYIKKIGFGGEVRVDDLELIDDTLFAMIFKNSISNEPIIREEFEERFQKALPIHIISKRLTYIPPKNHEVGLVGRDSVKKRIRAMLEKNDYTALVNGLGGIGKTAVMLQICYDLLNEGKYVAWIECGESLKHDLLLLRTAIGIPISDNADKAFEKIKKELGSNLMLAGNTYIFLDNLTRTLSETEQADLNGLGIHVMVTSRFEHDYFESIPLDSLEKEYAIEMFNRYYNKNNGPTYSIQPKEKTIIKEIVESVQCHTMLIELLAKAAKKKGGTLESFLNDLKEQGVFDVFKRKLSTKHDKNRTIEECVTKLYKFSELSDTKKHIMKLFTIFTPEKEIYYKVCEWAGLHMNDMDELVDLGWIERGGQENGYQIHQIVKDSLSRQMKNNGEIVKLEDYNGLLDKVVDTTSYLCGNVTHEIVYERIVLTEDVTKYLWGKWEACKSHQIDIEENTNLLIDFGRLLDNLTVVYYTQGDYEKALEYSKVAITVKENVLGSNHANIATTYINLTDIFHALGNYEKALEYCWKAIVIRKRELGRKHIDTAMAYNDLGVVFRAQGYYEKALYYYGKALVISERVLGSGHADTAMIYNNIAIVHYSRGNYEKALYYYKKAIKIREKVLDEDHPDLALTYNNVCVAYYELYDYEKALEYCQKALVIRERVLGDNHPETASTYNNMGGIYRAKKDNEKALEYCEKALLIKERVLEHNHPSIAKTYNNMAGVYCNKGDYDTAIKLYKKALYIFREKLGDNHKFTRGAQESVQKIESLIAHS